MCGSSQRREFLKEASSLAASLALVGAAAEGETAAAAEPADSQGKKNSPPLIDPHVHLWDLSRFRLPWTKNEPRLAKNFLLDDYLREARDLNVVKAIYMEVDVDPAQQQAEAQYVEEICRRGDTPLVAAVISGRPNSDHFEEYIRPFSKSRYIKGVRQVLHSPATPGGYCLEAKFVRGIQLLGELGMSFDLCMRRTELADADQLVAQAPRTRFVLDHCGGGVGYETDPTARAKWMTGMKALAQRENVVCKVSGIIASARQGWRVDDLTETIDFTLSTFGPDRVMFAGDWPVCTLRASLRQWVEALRSIVERRSAEERQKLFHDNAQKFYGV